MGAAEEGDRGSAVGGKNPKHRAFLADLLESSASLFDLSDQRINKKIPFGEMKSALDLLINPDHGTQYGEILEFQVIEPCRLYHFTFALPFTVYVACSRVFAPLSLYLHHCASVTCRQCTHMIECCSQTSPNRLVEPSKQGNTSTSWSVKRTSTCGRVVMEMTKKVPSK